MTDTNTITPEEVAAKAKALEEAAFDLVMETSARTRMVHIAACEAWREAARPTAALIATQAAFKAYVHQRLDAAGVPTHPDGPHSAAGCRIGDRLDIVLAAYAELARIKAAIAEKGGSEHAPTEWAYEAASAAVEKHRARADAAYAERATQAAEIERLREALTVIAKGTKWDSLTAGCDAAFFYQNTARAALEQEGG